MAVHAIQIGMDKFAGLAGFTVHFYVFDTMLAYHVLDESMRGFYGLKYLAWAYVEAAHYMQRFSSKAKTWFQRKAAKRGKVVATKALSNKIARSCYYIMKDQTVYDAKKMFG